MGKSNVLFLAGVWCFLIVGNPAKAQQAVKESDLKQYEERTKDLVSFLQYILNTVGNRATSQRDKEVIISESYQKIFRDKDVQVEDDLLADRLVVTNKDVTAYLKDIDFFFDHVQFEFEIVKVEPLKRDNGDWYFKVETNRTLKGVPIDGQDIQNTQKRFIEVNLDKEKEDLKIASIYTTRISREKALKEWWGNLSFEWMTILSEAAGVVVQEEPTAEQLLSMAAVDSLYLGNNRLIADIEPVEMLLDLAFLDISNTRVNDIGPLRGLSELAYLNVSSTTLNNVDYLKYAGNISVLDLSNTQVSDLAVLSQLDRLKELNVKSLPATDFGPLAQLTQLEKLDLSFTAFGDVELLANLVQLEILDISFTSTYNIEGLRGLRNLRQLVANQTFVQDLAPLSEAKALQVLEINETPVSSLQPLENLPVLEKVYCDNTSVPDAQADAFMRKKRNTLVIMNSRQLEDWWNSLPGEWRMAFQTELQIARGQKISKEHLVALIRSDSLVLVNKGIQGLAALERFKNLRFLDISKNPVNELISLSGLQNLRVLKANETPVENLSALRELKELEYIELINTKVYDLGPLLVLPKLRYLNIDDTFASQGSVATLLKANPESIVIYQTRVLQDWWNGLSAEWQAIFRNNADMSETPDPVDLHKLVVKGTIDASGRQIASLTPLYRFLCLKELKISAIGISDLSEIRQLSELEVLDCSKNPVSDLTPLRELVFLRVLNVSNTPVDDLRQIDNLSGLEQLYCAGTQLKNLKGVERFSALKEIDFANTKVRRLDRLIEIRKLQSLVCFNTRISSREISDFKKERPECAVTYY